MAKDSGEYGSSCNARVAYKAPYPKMSSGGPKSTSDGKDLSPDATNSLGKFSNKILSPSSHSHSRNQYKSSN